VAGDRSIAYSLIARPMFPDEHTCGSLDFLP
jgi:hypothetical protein